MNRVDAGFVVSALGFPLLVTALGGFPLIIIIAPVTILATIVVGLPVYLTCRKHRCFSLWPFLFGGVLAGVVFSLPFGLMFGDWEALRLFAEVFAAFGGCHGTIFWLVAIWRNDELRVPVAPNIE